MSDDIKNLTAAGRAKMRWAAPLLGEPASSEVRRLIDRIDVLEDELDAARTEVAALRALEDFDLTSNGNALRRIGEVMDERDVANARIKVLTEALEKVQTMVQVPSIHRVAAAALKGGAT